MLSNASILQAYDNKELDISPWNLDNLQPASYDVHLGSGILLPKLGNIRGSYYINPAVTASPVHVDTLPAYDNSIFYIPPGGQLLGHTEEILSLHSLDLAADIAGNSSLGRMWLFVHVTAGFIDPGWTGQLTLELFNASPWYIRIWAGMRIAQLRFYRLDTPATKGYNLVDSHYQGSRGAVESKYNG